MRAGLWFLLALVALIHSDGTRLLSRGLIKYDDHYFIAPLKDVSFFEYFTDYLWRKDVYTYPLRDLLYRFDFAFQDLTGASSFLLVNILWFLAFLFFFHRIARRLLSERWALAAVAIVGLHPQSVQAVQWISSRKHLMVACLGALMVARVLAVADRMRWSRSDFVILIALQLAIALSYSSGTMALFVACALLWASGFRKPACISAVAAFAVSGAATLFFAMQNQDFHQSTITGVHWKDVELTAGALGRMLANTLAPLHPSVYYREDSALNWLGLTLTLPLAGGFFLLIRNLDADRRRLSVALALGAASLFAPHVAFLLGYSEFFAADRYVFLPFPYALLAFAIPLEQRWSKWKLRKPGECAFVAKALTAVTLTVLAAFAFVSFRSIPPWRNEESLFADCAHTEGSGKCWAMLVENAFNAGGCPKAFPHFEGARATLLALSHPERAVQLSAELPLYEGICAATLSASLAERHQELDALERIYGPRPGIAFGRILLLLEEKRESDAGLLFANATIGSIGRGFANSHDKKTIEVFFGQSQYLCEKVSAIREACQTAILPQLVRNLPSRPSQAVATARELTERAHTRPAN